MKLTKAALSRLSLPAGKTEHFVWDDDIPGFGLRLRVGGARMLVFSYRQGVKQRRMTLCSASALDDLGFQRTRKRAAELHAQVRLGQDPAGQKIESRARAAETMDAALRVYLPFAKGRLKPRTYVEVERHLLKDSKPLHGLQLAAIDRRTIATRLTALAEHNGARTADAVRASLSTFFAWCMKQGLADANPVTGTAKAYTSGPRDRVLLDDELQAIWKALPDDHYGSIVKLLALTGQRRDEMASLRWSEIDLEKRTITLPPPRTKNKREHVVPLSAPAVAILKAQPRRKLDDGTERDLVFGIGDGGFSGWSDAKEKLNASIAEATKKPMALWKLHDLRRTAATVMADRLGVQPHIIEAVLNHVSGHKAGIAGVYNRASYEREKRVALDRWAEHVLAIVQGRVSKVVPLRQA
jgi:integrase